MPLLCVDAVIKNSAGKVLLVKRKNEPLKNYWWVPGGRVLKGETLDQTFHRKMREELGIRVKQLRCVGYYEAVNMPHVGIAAHGGRLHSLSIVFEARCDANEVSLDSQSSDWGYFDKLPLRFKVRPFGNGIAP
jgi:colanic acid biosynthesis protein WcaH